MPVNQATTEHAANDYSEEVDHILSSLPKWLKKWNIYIIVIVILGSLLIYQLFEKKLQFKPIYTTLNISPAPQYIEVKNLSKISQVYAVTNKRVVKGDTIAKLSEIGAPSKYQFLIAPISGVLNIKGDLKVGSILRKNQAMIEISADEEKTIYGELRINKTQADKFKPGNQINIELDQQGKEQFLQASIQQVDDTTDSVIIYYQVANPGKYNINPRLKQVRGKLVQEKTKFSFSSLL